LNGAHWERNAADRAQWLQFIGKLICAAIVIIPTKLGIIVV